MKPSHLTTPRTLTECNFVPGYASARYQQKYTTADRAVMWASAIAAVFVVLIVIFVPEVK